MAYTFQRQQRLLTASDYSAVFKQPDFKAGQGEILLIAKRNAGPEHRLGLAVAKKHVPTAVKRNLIKRLARERFRTLSGDCPTMDIVVLTRPGATKASQAQLSDGINKQFKRLVNRATQS